jgi:hypothetical protein
MNNDFFFYFQKAGELPSDPKTDDIELEWVL